MVAQQSMIFNAGDFSHSHKDVVFTPEWLAIKIIAHFKPNGRLLDPCRGDGVFHRHMPGADYCELQDGLDFFNWTQPLDWVIGNPPYSIFSEFLRHSFEVSNNIVYLIPINKAFNSSSMLNDTAAYGGIAEIIHIGPGSSLNFPVGFAVGAVHWKRNHKDGINYKNSFDE